MKKSVLIASIVSLAFSISAVAEEIVLSGDAGQGGGASLVCTPTSDGADFAYSPGVLVRTKSEGVVAGFVEQNGTGGKKVFVLKGIPDGTKIYLMGLAKDWGGPRNVDKVDVSKALASGISQGGVVKVHLFYQGKDGAAFNYAMLNAVGVLPNGTHAWAGVEGTTYSVKGPKGPFLLIAKTCEPSSAKAKEAAIALESRK